MNLLFLFLFMLQPKMAIDNSVSICKDGKILKIDYMNSYYGICSIKRSITSDTLNLTIYVSKIRNKTIKVGVPQNVRFIRYGNVIKKIDSINICPKVYSGKKALDHIKKDQ